MIRKYQANDLEKVIHVWLTSGKEEYDYLPDFMALNLATGSDVFRKEILSDCEVWVAELDGLICGFLAMKDNHIDRLYVSPDSQGKGIGSKLIEFAKQHNPKRITLRTHQQNHRARRFYEAHEFKIKTYGVSPAPELVPDVEYVWP